MSNAISQLFGTAIGQLSLKLGEIKFGHAEIPEKVNFGGEQGLKIHQLVGGNRVVHTTGANDHPQGWSGVFMGQTALERALFLDRMRTDGGQHLLVYGEQQYIVVIQSLSCQLERTYQIPYHISLVIVANLTAPVEELATLGYDDAEQQDLETALELADIIQNTPLLTQIQFIGTALSNAGVLSSATQEAINEVSDAITAAQSTTGNLIIESEKAVFG